MPKQIRVTAILGTIDYSYSASGERLGATYSWHSGLSLNPVENVNRPQYTTPNSVKRREYISNKEIENADVKRILFDNGYYSNGSYYFYLRDHLGNNCRVVKDNGQLIQCSYYFPYGGVIGNGESYGESAQPNKFGGKEEEPMFGLGLYDFHARQMDQAVPRFTTGDPLCEKYPNVSQYAYCKNNPVNMIDPDGMDDYYTNQGVFLFRDDKETDNIIIRTENYYKRIAEASNLSWMNTSEMPDFIDTPLTDLTLSAEAYSNIFTDILSKMDGIDTETLTNGQVAVRVMDGNTTYRERNCFNDPSTTSSHATANDRDGKNHVTAVVRVGEDRELYGTVSNVQNMLGDHEFKGHRVNGWGSVTKTHYKVYEFQMKQPSWSKTTNYYKTMVLDNYKSYLNPKR